MIRHPEALALFLTRLDYAQAVVHGRVLIDLQCEVARGRYSTTPADASDDLRHAEEAGWIVRGACEPTLSQRAFLGLQYKAGRPIPRLYASCWVWMRGANWDAAVDFALDHL